VSNIEDGAHVLTRREFTVESVLALLAGVTITVSGCGDDDNNPPTSPTPPASSDVNGSISGNHGHVATVTGAQITGAGAVSLNIQGTASHPHTVQLSAAEVQRIGTRAQVAKTSSNDNGHEHTVTFN
jgi:hypothetical protein